MAGRAAAHLEPGQDPGAPESQMRRRAKQLRLKSGVYPRLAPTTPPPPQPDSAQPGDGEKQSREVGWACPPAGWTLGPHGAPLHPSTPPQHQRICPRLIRRRQASQGRCSQWRYAAVELNFLISAPPPPPPRSIRRVASALIPPPRHLPVLLVPLEYPSPPSSGIGDLSSSQACFCG